MRRTLCIAGLLGACLGTPVAAVHAQGTIAPPGASGVDEYLETVPTDAGNQPLNGRKPSGHALTRKQVAALARLGPDGKAAAVLADSTGPSRPSGHGRGNGLPSTIPGS